MGERDPPHSAAVAVGISAGADDEIFRHAADFSPLTSDLCLVRASEKSCQCKDLSPECREQNRGRRCNRRLARTDSSQNHSCPAPASRSSNRLPSWKPLVFQLELSYQRTILPSRFSITLPSLGRPRARFSSSLRRCIDRRRPSFHLSNRCATLSDRADERDSYQPPAFAPMAL